MRWSLTGMSFISSNDHQRTGKDPILSPWSAMRRLSWSVSSVTTRQPSSNSLVSKDLSSLDEDVTARLESRLMESETRNELVLILIASRASSAALSVRFFGPFGDWLQARNRREKRWREKKILEIFFEKRSGSRRIELPESLMAEVQDCGVDTIIHIKNYLLIKLLDEPLVREHLALETPM